MSGRATRWLKVRLRDGAEWSVTQPLLLGHLKQSAPLWSERLLCKRLESASGEGGDEEGCPGAPALLEKLSFCVALTVSVAKAGGDDCAPDLGRRRIAVQHHKGALMKNVHLFFCIIDLSCPHLALSGGIEFSQQKL